MKNLKFLALLVALASLIASQPLFAAAVDSPQLAASKKALSTVSLIELPAKAANLVSQASDKEQTAVTISVVQTGIGLAPTAALAIVRAVAHDVPGMAPTAAVTAAKLQKKQLALIAKTAATAAPSQAAKIVAALIHEFPSQYPAIAVAAAEGVPSAGREILAAVADFVPALQAPIENAVAATKGGGDVPVEIVLQQSTAAYYHGTATPNYNQAAPATFDANFVNPTVRGGYGTKGVSVVDPSRSGTEQGPRH